MSGYTLAELSRMLRGREISSTEIVQSCLDRAQRCNDDLNCFISLFPEHALEQAKAADSVIAAGEAGPLTGLPVAHKDIFCTAGYKTSCGSKMLDSFVAPYQATAMAKLDAAGIVMLGKTNMDEFAMGSSNENSCYGPVRNPWDAERVPGGSSGGSACAVSARIVPAATGTDTGGSIRQPAALCGVTGLKPTYGRVSRYGMIAYASSLDQGGPIAQTAQDAAMLLGAMSGHDPRDATSADVRVDNYMDALNNEIKGLKIGLSREYFSPELEQPITDAITAALNLLEQAGASVIDVELPHTDLSIPVYYVIASAECSSNLSRYDGVRFGHRCPDPEDINDLFCRSRGEGFGDEVKRRIMIGAYVLSAGYYDAYYLKAQRLRRMLRDEFRAALDRVDVIVTPTTPTTAFPLGSRIDDPVSMYLSDIYTVSVNLAGLPAISVPAGFSDGLPIGMQIIGNYFQEARLLNVAHRYQQMTDWHKQVPGGWQ
ncbi:MAG: Asp-tRNA(Asn)/Glu-tRNA(Gln) amidotransferase subunit GatA [Gammaproteobacteria bacterium]|nr:Asp-tRNA(Asn)/Glu-tRNA(Gln) amidotransferase subunit GatA [Gammaproteobacteria bacterium]